MKYSDGNEALPGDVVAIDGEYRGRVVACIDAGTFLPGHDGWDYLLGGIMVDTDFGGLVHYTVPLLEDLRLIERMGGTQGT